MPKPKASLILLCCQHIGHFSDAAQTECRVERRAIKGSSSAVLTLRTGHGGLDTGPTIGGISAHGQIADVPFARSPHFKAKLPFANQLRTCLRPRARGFGRNPVERLMRHANAEQLIKEICGIQPLAFSGN
jgi:hypothetical protein